MQSTIKTKLGSGYKEVMLKVTNIENLKMDSKLLYLIVKDIHDSHVTVSNSFGPYLRLLTIGNLRDEQKTL